MKVNFSKKSAKFLENLDDKNRERARIKIRSLVLSLEEGIIPFKELDIKKLKGEWKDFFRLRIGNIRIIFRIDKEKDELIIFEIDYRGGVYKK